jgi:hypothetical protein
MARRASLDRALVGFDAVITVTSRVLSAAAVHMTFLLQFANGSRIAAQSIPCKNSRRSIVRIRQSALEQQFGGFAIPRFRQLEVHGLAAAFDGAE